MCAAATASLEVTHVGSPSYVTDQIAGPEASDPEPFTAVRKRGADVTESELHVAGPEAGPAAMSGPTVPGPRRTAALPMLMVMRRDRLGMLTSAVAKYGDAARLPVGPNTLYLFNHPDYAKHVPADNAANYHKGIGEVHARRALGDGLLTSEGDVWRKQRKVIQPAFAARRIAQQSGVVAE